MTPAVAMLAGVFPPQVGGIQTQVLQLGRKLVERGVEVHVLTRHLSGLRREEELDGVHVHRVGNGDAPRGVRAATYLFGALKALRTLRHRVDLLHAHQIFAPAALALAGSAMARKPLVINPHNHTEVAFLEQRGASGRLLLAAARAKAHAFISICRPIREELERIGIAPERIHDIGNGVDTTRFRPASADERLELRRTLGLPAGPLVIYAGRLSREKGLDLLLQAWPGVAAGSHLCIVGDGEEREALQAQAAGLRGVRFHGAVTDVAPLMRAADACVLPSRVEGLPVALLEGMSCGLPVVATAVGGTPGAVEDGATGLLVPPEDPGALAEALCRALGTEGSALGRLARARVLQSYSIDAVADRVLGLYRMLCEQAEPRLLRVAH
jgi:glycosyltransferase involved in cell wall biosynthesis